MKKRLEKIKKSLKNLISIQMTIDRLSFSIQAIPISERVETSPGNIFEEKIIERMSIIEELKGKLKKVNDEMIALEERMERLQEDERAVIRLYYFTDLTWEQVADELHYSEKQARRIAEEGVKKMSVNVRKCP